MKWVAFALLLLTTTGCVSVGYHQRAVNAARLEELTKVKNLIKQVEEKELSIQRLDNMIKADWAELRNR